MTLYTVWTDELEALCSATMRMPKATPRINFIEASWIRTPADPKGVEEAVTMDTAKNIRRRLLEATLDAFPKATIDIQSDTVTALMGPPQGNQVRVILNLVDMYTVGASLTLLPRERIVEQLQLHSAQDIKGWLSWVASRLPKETPSPFNPAITEVAPKLGWAVSQLPEATTSKGLLLNNITKDLSNIQSFVVRLGQAELAVKDGDFYRLRLLRPGDANITHSWVQVEGRDSTPIDDPIKTIIALTTAEEAADALLEQLGVEDGPYAPLKQEEDLTVLDPRNLDIEGLFQ